MKIAVTIQTFNCIQATPIVTDRIFIGNAVPTVYLDAVVPHHFASCGHNRTCDRQCATPRLHSNILSGKLLIERRTGLIGRNKHVGSHVLNSLKFSNRLAKLLAFLGVVTCQRDSGFHSADSLSK